MRHTTLVRRTLAVVSFAAIGCAQESPADPIVSGDHAEAPAVPLTEAGRILVEDALSRLIPSIEGRTEVVELRSDLTGLLEHGVPVELESGFATRLGGLDPEERDLADLDAIALSLAALDQELIAIRSGAPATASFQATGESR